MALEIGPERLLTQDYVGKRPPEATTFRSGPIDSKDLSAEELEAPPLLIIDASKKWRRSGVQHLRYQLKCFSVPSYDIGGTSVFRLDHLHAFVAFTVALSTKDNRAVYPTWERQSQMYVFHAEQDRTMDCLLPMLNRTLFKGKLPRYKI